MVVGLWVPLDTAEQGLPGGSVGLTRVRGSVGCIGHLRAGASGDPQDSVGSTWYPEIGGFEGLFKGPWVSVGSTGHPEAEIWGLHGSF